MQPADMDRGRVVGGQVEEEVAIGAGRGTARDREDIGRDQHRAVTVQDVARIGAWDLVNQRLERRVQLGLPGADLLVRQAAQQRVDPPRGHRQQRQFALPVFGDGRGGLLDFRGRIRPDISPGGRRDGAKQQHGQQHREHDQQGRAIRVPPDSERRAASCCGRARAPRRSHAPVPSLVASGRDRRGTIDANERKF
jgi:hypothetical protein